MKQGLLAFQYEQEKGSTGMTGLSGLMTYLELMQAAGLRSSVERHVRLRERGQGWTDSQMIISLMLLNLAGGESVSDLDLLEKDRGLCRMFREFETCGMRLSERRALEKRWRVERRRSVPSESAVFRYLERFHSEEPLRWRKVESVSSCDRLRAFPESTGYPHPCVWLPTKAMKPVGMPRWTPMARIVKTARQLLGSGTSVIPCASEPHTSPDSSLRSEWHLASRRRRVIASISVYLPQIAAAAGARTMPPCSHASGAVDERGLR